MDNWSELIRAIGSLLGAIAWPIVIFLMIVLFRKQIAELLERLQKLKLFGQEMELMDKKLDEFQTSVVEAVESVSSPPTTSVGDTQPEAEEVPSPVLGTDFARQDRVIKSILEEATKSPKVGLILLSTEIERELRIHITPDYVSGVFPKWPIPIMESIKLLDERGRIPHAVLSSAMQFWQVRNELIHGGDTNESDTIRAIDSGITLLRALHAIPRETNVVLHSDVLIYSDPNATTPRGGVRAVILQSISEGGMRGEIRAFPTARTDYRVGEIVTWEWNPHRQSVVEESWYRDPETQEIKYGWRQALLFAGRHLDDPV